MSANSRLLDVIQVGRSGYSQEIDSAGNLQVDVNNAVTIDDPVDVNVVTHEDDPHKTVRINANAATNTVLAGISGKKIHVKRWHITANDDNVKANVYFQFNSETTVRFYPTRIPRIPNDDSGFTIGRTCNFTSSATAKALELISDTADIDVDVFVEYVELTP